MSRERTVEEKVADWKAAYDMIRPELTPDNFRALTELVQNVKTEAFDPAIVHIAMDVARVVFANDRATGEIAAELTKYSVKHEAPI